MVIRNHLFKQANVEVELKLPPELDCSVPNRSFKIAPKTRLAVPFRLRRLWDSEERQVVTADLTINISRLLIIQSVNMAYWLEPSALFE